MPTKWTLNRFKRTRMNYFLSTFKILIDDEYIETTLFELPKNCTLIGSKEKPFIIEYRNNKTISEQWVYNEYIHRETGPAETLFWQDGSKHETWVYNGRQYSISSPNFINHPLYPYYISWNKEKYTLEYEALLKTTNLHLFD